ncbi:hypothetical protein ACWDYH_24965 [Nocardia goodfellowii]
MVLGITRNHDQSLSLAKQFLQSTDEFSRENPLVSLDNLGSVTAVGKRTGGRPRSEFRGASAELNELAALLWDEIDASGLNLRDIHERFTSDHFPSSQGPPSIATLYKRSCV